MRRVHFIKVFGGWFAQRIERGWLFVFTVYRHDLPDDWRAAWALPIPPHAWTGAGRRRSHPGNPRRPGARAASGSRRTDSFAAAQLPGQPGITVSSARAI